MRNILILIFITLVIIIPISLTNCQSIAPQTDNTQTNIENNPEIQEKLNEANFYLSRGNIEEAREIFFELLKANKEGELNLPKYFVAELYYNIGFLFENEINMEMALNYYQISLKKYREINFIEESFIVSMAIARIYYYMLDYDNTLKYLNLCIDFYKTNLDKKNIYPVVTQISKIYFNTDGTDKAIDYLENILKENTFQYNEKEEINILTLLAVYYIRKGSIQEYKETIEKINKKTKKLKLDKSNIEYNKHLNIYNNINTGNYNLALGLIKMGSITDEMYFEILRLTRMTEQESINNIPISADYFNEYPQLYAGIFLIEAGYIEAKKINLEAGLNKITKANEFFKIKKDKFHLAESYLAKGKIYYLKGFYTKAIDNFINCSELYKELNLCFEYAISQKYAGFSLLNQKDYERAIDYIRNSIICFEKIENKYELAPLYETLGYIYKDMSDNQLAIIYLKKAIKTYIEIDNKEKAETIKNDMENIKVY